MKSKMIFTRRQKIATLIISAVLLVAAHLVPFNAVPAGQTGRSAINYGLPFTVLSTSTASYPAAPTTSDFHLWGLAANIVIVCSAVALVTYSFHFLRNRSNRP